jgi:predicted DsbA family dithiol-disulfide isomerase
VKPIINIDIVSDVVCPWCYIGKRRLDNAIAQLADRYDFNITHHPFELNPDLPASGENQKEYLVKRFGGESKYQQLTSHTARAAAAEGLHFDFDKQRTMPNTRKAHSIVMDAKDTGKQSAVIENFFKGYFSDGVDLSKNENLVSMAVDAGLNKERIEQVLADPGKLKEVAQVESEFRKLGVHAVPFFILNGRYALSGAQPIATFVNAIKEIGEKPEIQEAPSYTTDG